MGQRDRTRHRPAWCGKLAVECDDFPAAPYPVARAEDEGGMMVSFIRSNYSGFGAGADPRKNGLAASI